jgi:hypothetical protein
MAAAEFAPLSVALFRLVEDPNMLRSLGNLNGSRLPKRERVDGTARPASARFTVAISGAHRFTRHEDFNGSAEASANIA